MHKVIQGLGEPRYDCSRGPYLDRSPLPRRIDIYRNVDMGGYCIIHPWCFNQRTRVLLRETPVGFLSAQMACTVPILYIFDLYVRVGLGLGGPTGANNIKTSRGSRVSVELKRCVRLCQWTTYWQDAIRNKTQPERNAPKQFVVPRALYSAMYTSIHVD